MKNINYLKRFLLIVCYAYLLMCNRPLHAQIIYGFGSSLPSNGNQMFQINLATCEICLVATLTNSFGGNNAAVILANGNVVATDGGFIRMYDPPNPNAVATLNVLPFTPSGVALSPGGVVYVSGVSPAGLGIYNPTSNTFTNIGSWPAGIQGVLDMFYWNGQLYGLAFQGGLPYILAIDVANPAASTIVTPITGVTGAVGVTAIPGIGIFLVTDTDDAIYNIDLNTGTGTLECSFLTQFEIIGLTIAPPSAPAFSCLCATNAGTLPTQALQNICVNAQLLFPAAAGTVLDNNDLLQYVLFSNPADTAGSIVAVSNIPSFSFMGVQQNASLKTSGIAVEGFRAQFPTFPTLGPPPTPANLGGAVNLQVVRSPFGGQFNQSPIDIIAAQGSSNNPDYAELSWQDFGYGGPATATDCSAATGLPINLAQELDKFFISFRNNQNVNPFGVGNKLPVMTFQANGRVGIGTLQPTSGSGCTGNVYNRPILLDVNGVISSSGTLLSSDKRFKQNIKPVDDALSLIRRLQGTKYEFRTEEFKDRNFPQGNQYGFIAQDVEKVIPEMAFENSDGYYVMNYTMLIPVLTEAIKQQDKTITEQATTITELRTEIAELRSAFNDFKAGQAANGVEGYRLEQNAPNPFSQNTVIGYAVPAGTTGARVNVYDLAGRLVKSFNIADQSGQITMNAGDMSNGLYIYDLQVNGRQILERKMTVVKD
jgi:hypothetical protein